MNVILWKLPSAWVPAACISISIVTPCNEEDPSLIFKFSIYMYIPIVFLYVIILSEQVVKASGGRLAVVWYKYHKLILHINIHNCLIGLVTNLPKIQQYIQPHFTRSPYVTLLSRRAQSDRISYRQTGVFHRITYSFSYFIFYLCFIYSFYSSHNIWNAISS